MTEGLNCKVHTIKIVVSLDLIWFSMGLGIWPRQVGVIDAEGPPVPIPNTEVKLCYADNTCLETGRDDRSMPTQKDWGN